MIDTAEDADLIHALILVQQYCLLLKAVQLLPIPYLI